ncbi:MAG: 2-oxo acid dehydrogenase subunit E2 [Candidatus Thermoplasmatota archaeon]|nr:2-oxo acid dehydrogenase subunit E2 [Candidatus Thermoplasmatota archaeon]
MTQEFKMPDIGEGLTEGEIGKWLVEEGQAIKENDPLVEVLTEKVNVEIPSPYAGTVLELLAAEGDVVEVGTAIVVIGEKGEKGKKGKGKAKEEEPPVEEKPPKEEKEDKKAKAEEDSAEEPAPSGKALATPAVRRVARELDIELQEVKGTGARGRITERDVRAFAEGAPPAEAEAAEAPVEEAPPEEAPAEEALSEEPPVEPVPVVEAGPAPPEELIERVKVRGIRRTISERMLKSKNTAAHFTYVEEVDVTALVSLRKRVKAWAEERGVRLTYLPFILKALVAALKENPTLNATVDWENEEVLIKRYYNIGVATATEAGLLAPVVRDVDQKSILAVAREVDALSEKARAGKLTLEDVHDPTFTVTSLGVIGGVLATPIIHHPQLAILGVHKIAKRPMVRDGQIVIREMMNVSVSFDHRIIDGHVGAAFTQSLVRYLEDPGVLLLHLLEAEGNGP